MTRKRFDTATRKKHIVEAALHVIGEMGASALTVERVAKQVGFGPSAIYRHFSSKTELFEEVLDFIREELLRDVDEACQNAPTPVDAMYRALMKHVDVLLAGGSIPRLIFSDAIRIEDERLRARMESVLDAFIQKISQVLSEAQKQGLVRDDIPAKDLAITGLGILPPAAFLHHLKQEQFDLQYHVNCAWQVFLQGAMQPDAKFALTTEPDLKTKD